MSVNITDVSAFTSPATGPSGADLASAGNVTGHLQKLANRTKYLKDAIDGETAPTVRIPITAFIVDSADAWEWDLGLGSTRMVFRALATGTYDLRAGLNRYLPDGAVITRVRAPMFVQSGSTIEVRWEEQELTLATWVASGTVIDTSVVLRTETNGGADARSLVDSGVLGTPRTVSQAKTQGLRLHLAGHADDLIYEVVVSYNNPGARNT